MSSLFLKMAVFFTFLITLLLTLSIEGTNTGGRIIGGQQGNAGAYPFIAAISVYTSTSTFFCAGSLIGPQWILTAAQCVKGAVQFTIALGSNSLQGTDQNRVILSTSEYVAHPDFDPATLDHDIGLIRLRVVQPYTDYIQKIFMAFSVLDEQTNLVAIGWGQTSDAVAGLTNNLEYVDVAALSNDECRATYGNQINENMVCVSGQYNQGICTGDSGGPLLHYEGNIVVRHVGIASFYSGNGCESTNPSGYTRTLPYRSWITNVTGIIS